MRKVLLLTLLFSGLLPLGCSRSSCDGEDFSDIKNFHIKSLQLKTTDKRGKDVDTSLYYRKDSVLKSIEVKEKVDVAYQNKKPSLFINSVYACSPPVPESDERVIELDIIAKTKVLDSGITINEGDNITNMFWMSLPLPTNLYLFHGIWLQFLRSVSKNTVLKFDVNVKLSDGKTFTFKDEVLKLEGESF